MSFNNAKLLEGDWPILQTATPYIFEWIKASTDGTELTSWLGYLSLGDFYIHTGLLEAHTCQRPTVLSHAEMLKEEFKAIGIRREEYPGLIIGLGPGWLQMKNNEVIPYKITPSCTHLSRLSINNAGPIGQVLRGGRRTEAVRLYAAECERPEDNYWLYKVLIPGMF